MTAEIRLNKFAQKYKDSYPPEIHYRRLNDQLDARSTKVFQQSRKVLLEKLLVHRGTTIGMPHGLLSEFVVDIAIDPLIDKYGYRIHMAPQSLENGNNQRGVDLLFVDNKYKIMLGIDVKLRADKHDRGRNGGAWLNNLDAPFINLGLGNWQVEVKDKSVRNVKDWLVKCVLPNVNESGSIPRLNDFRKYLVRRIINSLDYQLENLGSYHPIDYNNLPMDRQQTQAYRQKLRGVIELLTKVETVKLEG